MTRKQKREAIIASLHESPEKSNRAIAKLVGCDGKTVAAVRRGLERAGEVSPVKFSTAPSQLPSPTGRYEKSLSRGQYGDEEVQLTLTAVAKENGNVNRAVRVLAKLGFKVNPSTARGWVERFPELYGEARTQVLPALNEEAGERFRALMVQGTEVQAAMFTRLAEHHEEIPIPRLPGAIKDVSIPTGVAADKARLHTEQPTQIIQQASIAESLRALRASPVKFYPHEVIEVEVIEESESGGDNS